MTKIINICIFYFLVANTFYAQEVLYFTNFDSLNVGDKVALTVGKPWFTWSNTPGSIEDANISNMTFFSDSNSMKIVNDNDIIFKYGNVSTGRYITKWKIFVEKGKLGYFNVLKQFDNLNIIRSFNCYIENDTLILKTADWYLHEPIAFKSNVWHEFTIVVDLNDNYASIFIDGLEILSSKWSGTLFNSPSKRFEGVDFYGWNKDGSSAGYYIDDFTFLKMDTLKEPISLTAKLVGKDVVLNWNVPDTSIVEYYLYKNGKFLTKTSSTTYLDVSVLPNEYKYSIRGRLSGVKGYTPSAYTSIIVTGGIDRNLILFEGFTGTNYPACYGVNQGLYELINSTQYKAVAISYHNEDDYEINDSKIRKSYYNITHIPTTVVDGGNDGNYIVEGNSYASLLSSFIPAYYERIKFPALHDLVLDVKNIGKNKYRVDINVSEEYACFDTIKLHAALIESINGYTELNYTCRKMIPDGYGFDLIFIDETKQSLSFDFSIEGYSINNSQLIVFLQDEKSKEITQTVKVDLASIVGIDQLDGKDISIYPNPASDYIKLLTNGKGSYAIYNMSGTFVNSGIINKTEQYIDISGLPNGVYIMRATNSNYNFKKKFFVNKSKK